MPIDGAAAAAAGRGAKAGPGARSAGGQITRLIRATANYGLSSVLQPIIGFLLIPLYTRFLTPEDYGVLGLATSIGGVLVVFMRVGLTGAITRYYYDLPDAAAFRRFFSSITLTLVVWAGAIAVVLSVFGEPLMRVLAPGVPFNPYLLLVIWSAFLGLMPQVLKAQLQVRERSAEHSAFTLASFLLTLLLTIGFVVGLRLGALGNLLAEFLVSLVLFVVSLVLMRRHLAPIVHPPHVGSALRYGLPLVPHHLSGWVLAFADTVVLAQFTNLATVGLYTVGYRFAVPADIALGAFTTAWTPIYFSIRREQGESAAATLRTMVTYIVFGFLSLFLGIILFAPDAIRIITPSTFHASYQIVFPLVMARVFQLGYQLTFNAVFFSKKTARVPLVTFTGVVVNVIFYFIFIPPLGALGAAWATAMAYCVTFLMAWSFSHRLFPVRYDYARIGAMLAFFLSIIGVHHLVVIDSVALSIAARFALWGLFPAALIVFGLVRTADIARLWARIAAARQAAAS